MMKVSMKVIPHNKQRYETVGDWWFNQNNLVLRVSDMKNDDYHSLVLLHEFVEAVLCRKADVDEAVVTDFDINYEAERKEGDLSEPGDDPSAPYFKQHQIATQIERIFAEALEINWEEYEKAIYSL